MYLDNDFKVYDTYTNGFIFEVPYSYSYVNNGVVDNILVLSKDRLLIGRDIYDFSPVRKADIGRKISYGSVFSRDLSRLYYISGMFKKKIKVYELSSRCDIMDIDAQTHGICAISPKNNIMCLLKSRDPLLCEFFDINENKSLYDINMPIENISFSIDEKLIYIQYKRTYYVYSSEEKDLYKTISNCVSMRTNYDNKLAFIIDNDCSLNIYEIDNWRFVKRIENDDINAGYLHPCSMDISSDGTKILLRHNDGHIIYAIQ